MLNILYHSKNENFGSFVRPNVKTTLTFWLQKRNLVDEKKAINLEMANR